MVCVCDGIRPFSLYLFVICHLSIFCYLHRNKFSFRFDERTGVCYTHLIVGQKSVVSIQKICQLNVVCRSFASPKCIKRLFICGKYHRPVHVSRKFDKRWIIVEYIFFCVRELFANPSIYPSHVQNSFGNKSKTPEKRKYFCGARSVDTGIKVKMNEITEKDVEKVFVNRTWDPISKFCHQNCAWPTSIFLNTFTRAPLTFPVANVPILHRCFISFDGKVEIFRKTALF